MFPVLVGDGLYGFAGVASTLSRVWRLMAMLHGGLRPNAGPQSQPSGNPTQPPTSDKRARTSSGIVMVGGDSCTWCATRTASR